MELVGTHNATDIVATALFVVCRHARPETSDLKDQFGAVELEELEVIRDLQVLPDVPGDGTAHVSLPVAVVRDPALGPRVQVEFLRLLLAVAAALPREHR